MRSVLYLLEAAALVPIAHCVAFAGPKPTAPIPYRALDGWSPKPTQGPRIDELRRRQFDSSETCGWVDGDYSSEIGCDIGSTCMLYTAGTVGMAGCCTAFDFQDCNWVNTCMDYSTLMSGGCDSACMRNTFIRKCTNTLSPYCVSWTYPSDNVQDYGCGTEPVSTFETVQKDITDAYDLITTSLSLPYVADSLVTGWESTTATGKSRTTSTLSDSSSAPSATAASSKPSGFHVTVGLIAGIAAAAFVIILAIAGLIIFCCMRSRQKKQQAVNTTALAAAAASRPQSQYYGNQPMQQQPIAPPQIQTQQLQQQGYEYFNQPNETKINPQVYPYAVSSPISSPPTPAPAYQTPFPMPNAAHPPLPTASPAPEHGMRPPTAGAVEVSAVSVPHMPGGGQGPFYELGSGK